VDGIESIVDHILNQAREKIALVEASSSEQLAEIERQSAEACEAAARQIEAKAQAQADAVLNRATSQAALETRRTLLETRQKVIDEVLLAALDELCQLESQAKADLYAGLIASTGATHGQITVNEQDRGLMAELLPKLPGQFELAEAAGRFAGGILLRRGRIEENLTFDLLLRNQRPQLAALAAGILYPDA
jgi:vacuolar-type H+-ATPase subunit E/Vma4